MLKKILLYVCVTSTSLSARAIPTEFTEIVQLILREIQNKEVQVGVYRRFSLADAQSNNEYIEWRSSPDNILNSGITPRPEQFVLIQRLTKGASKFITIHPIVRSSDLFGDPPVIFSGGESTAYILIIQKDKNYPKGDLYRLVGGIDNVIAKKDVIPPEASLPPRFNYLFDDGSFELLVTSLRDAIAANAPPSPAAAEPVPDRSSKY